jgi:hypothetical protein
VLSGYDDDLACDATRQTNRLRDALTTLSPPLERVLGRPAGACGGAGTACVLSHPKRAAHPPETGMSRMGEHGV